MAAALPGAAAAAAAAAAAETGHIGKLEAAGNQDTPLTSELTTSRMPHQMPQLGQAAIGVCFAEETNVPKLLVLLRELWLLQSSS